MANSRTQVFWLGPASQKSLNTRSIYCFSACRDVTVQAF
jgi:hypothetical protein